MYIYVSNESLGSVEAFFDDILVEHKESKVTQVADYYPFGMQIKQTSTDVTNPLANKYLYQGKELQQETEIYDFHARGYDPVLGRTWQIDPMAEKYYSLSSYSWVANNPIILMDPTGMEIDWGQLEGKEKRIAKRALRKHNSSGTYKNLYKQLKKSDNRYVIKASHDENTTT
jgi:RHS repeat-associated protein